MSQLERVIAVMSDGKERTLRDIERAIWWRYHIGDTQARLLISTPPILIGVNNLLISLR